MASVWPAVCDTAKVRFFKQITTILDKERNTCKLFVILQKYDFSSKSQRERGTSERASGCLWYCKSTIFQANHNPFGVKWTTIGAVCDTAKVRFFKQITTDEGVQRTGSRCLWYCKSTIFQANHNSSKSGKTWWWAVCDTAKVRFFKQITTKTQIGEGTDVLFVILQKYDFSSKSQPSLLVIMSWASCLWYCKSTIFQANHNRFCDVKSLTFAVCDTAKVRFFKQITTAMRMVWEEWGCLWYCKSTIFQANHNRRCFGASSGSAVCDTAKVRFFKQITTEYVGIFGEFVLFVILQKYDFSSKSQPNLNLNQKESSCLWYCKSTIFQANHNRPSSVCSRSAAVCDTAKVRFFKQITTSKSMCAHFISCLWYCKSTIFQANHN